MNNALRFTSAVLAAAFIIVAVQACGGRTSSPSGALGSSPAASRTSPPPATAPEVPAPPTFDERYPASAGIAVGTFTVFALDEHANPAPSLKPHIVATANESASGATLSAGTAALPESDHIYLYVKYDPARYEPVAIDWASNVSRPSSLRFSAFARRAIVAVGVAELRGARISGTIDVANVRFRPSTGAPSRTVSSAPTTDPAGKVTDLGATNSNGNVTLTWHEMNVGDSNNDGEVNIGDLGPIAQYYGDSSGPGPDQVHMKMIDLDGSGEINIADLGPLAANFMDRIDGYNLYRSPNAAPPSWVKQPNIGNPSKPSAERTATPPPGAPVQYSYNQNVSYGDYLYEVRPVDTVDSTEGVASAAYELNYVQTPPTAPTNLRVAYISPTEVDLMWNSNTESDLAGYNLYRDTDPAFGAPVCINQAAGLITNTLYADTAVTTGTHYYYRLKAMNTASMEGPYSNQADAIPNAPPIAVANVSPTSEWSTKPIDFDATGSNDPDGGAITKWEWDFGEGAGWQDFTSTSGVTTHSYATGGTFTAKLRVTDDMNTTGIAQKSIKIYDISTARTDILIVYNSSDPTSTAIKDYYASPATGRGITDPYICGLNVVTDENTTRAYYDSIIKPAIEAYITANGIKNNIKYIVTTKNFPYRIGATGGTNYFDLDYASVDSEMCMLFQTPGYAVPGRTWNAYYINTGVDYGSDQTPTPHHFTPFETAGTYKISYLVCRLTAYSLQGVFDIIDRSKQADTAPHAADGWWIIDDQGKTYDWMELARTRMLLLTSNVDSDAVTESSDQSFVYTAANIANPAISDNVIGYTSHGIHNGFFGVNYIWDPTQAPNFLGFTYLPGAIFETYESFNGDNFTSTDGTPATVIHPQGLLGDFLYMGGTCGLGNVYEPWSDACGDEAKLLPLYYQGYDFGEAAYMALRFVSWVQVAVGDPLCKISAANPMSMKGPSGFVSPADLSGYTPVPVGR